MGSGFRTGREARATSGGGGEEAVRISVMGMRAVMLLYDRRFVVGVVTYERCMRGSPPKLPFLTMPIGMTLVAYALYLPCRRTKEVASVKKWRELKVFSRRHWYNLCFSKRAGFCERRNTSVLETGQRLLVSSSTSLYLSRPSCYRPSAALQDEVFCTERPASVQSARLSIFQVPPTPASEYTLFSAWCKKRSEFLATDLLARRFFPSNEFSKLGVNLTEAPMLAVPRSESEHAPVVPYCPILPCFPAFPSPCDARSVGDARVVSAASGVCCPKARLLLAMCLPL
ncbi:hypothetical protein BDV95DRAFT_288621 [Massariosphaeria phaeospora]|uniref:Uncharacterized protein n=1 Tax=Massariosphaeria phaeospora TaxID=100035 RepID=A0A7C8MG24_9PLEO|nr:hypothetical protein BDV95DRAFT_288621 [Massariosphaeria phaeospora]